MKKNQVFISYKSEDISVAEQFHLELDRHRISNWFDRERLPREVSKEYKSLIHYQIENSELLLLLYSEKVNDSDFIIREEVGYALSHDIPVFCFLLDNSPMSAPLRELVGSKQWLCSFQDLSRMSSGYLLESVYDEKRRGFLQSLIEDKIRPSYLGENYNDINLFLMRIAIQRHLGIPTTFGTYTQLEQSEGVYRRGELTINVVPKALFWEVPEDMLPEMKALGFLTDPKPVIDPDVDAFCEGCDRETLRRQLVEFVRKNYPDISDVEAYLSDIARQTAQTLLDDLREGAKRFNGAMLGVCDMRIQRTPNDERHLLALDMYISDYYTFKFTVELYHRLRTRNNRFDITRIEQIREYAPFLCSLGMGGYVVVAQEEQSYLMWTKRDATISSGDMWHFSFDETAHLKKDAIRGADGRVAFYDGCLRIDPYNNFYRGMAEELGLTEPMLAKDRSGIFEVGIITSDRLEIELLSYATYRAAPEPSVEEQMFPITESAPDGKYEISKIRYVPLERCQDEFIGQLVTPESYALYQRIHARHNRQRTVSAERVYIDPLAVVGGNVVFEPDVHISAHCRIGDNCKIHRHVFLDERVTVGSNVKIQNHNNLYTGVSLADGVFVGPNVTFTNDKYPRSINADGSLKSGRDWICSETKIGYGASLGGGCVVVCGVSVGARAMVGAGAVVTKDVPARALVTGNPAVIRGWVSDSGQRLQFVQIKDGEAVLYAPEEGREYTIPVEDYIRLERDAACVEKAGIEAERARLERLRNAAAEETETSKIAVEKLRQQAEHRIAALDAEYEQARRQAEIEARKHDFEMSRLAAEKAGFERKSEVTPEQARAIIEQVRKDIARPDKTPLYVWSAVYALLTGGYVVCAALLCRQIGNGVSAIVLLAVVTLVWGVLTLLLCRLLRSRAEVVRKQTERYDNLMNVLDERRIRLLDKEL